MCHAGYVYYEADCFAGLKNPYIPPDVDNPSLAQSAQRPLCGEGMEERSRIADKAHKMFVDMFQGGQNLYSNFSVTEYLLKGKGVDSAGEREFYTAMCEDIKRERARIGGDWAVAGVALTQHSRQHIRSQLGRELVFVILTMEEEKVRARLEGRHAGNTQTVDVLMVSKIMPCFLTFLDVM